MKIDEFGMDTVSLAGPLEARLRAIRDAGFSQVMLSAGDVASHPDGVDAAAKAVRTSGLRVTGLQVLRDFEGLSGTLHAYKVDIAKAMIEMCSALGCKLLLACSSTLAQASTDSAALARDLRKLAMLALPRGIKVAYEALSWGCSVNRFAHAWDVVCEADCPNLGIALDAFHVFAADEPLEDLDLLDPRRIHLVQLSDFMGEAFPGVDEDPATAGTFRVFPGEGVHSDRLVRMVTTLDRLGYRGDYSFEVFNDDYRQLPLPMVAERARRAAVWLSEDVLRRSVPLGRELSDLRGGTPLAKRRD